MKRSPEGAGGATSGEALAGLNVAVTGGRGFLGRALIHALESLEVKVTRIDGDIRDAETWQADFDVLYHFAAAMPASFKSALYDGYSTNVGGLLQALEACRRRRARLIFPSTCGVYRPRDTEPLAEDDPVEPLTAYDESKRIGEMLCESYARRGDVPVTVCRLFNVYGPGQKQEFLIPYLVKSGIEGVNPTVYNMGSARDFLFITDATSALLRAVHGEKVFSIYNIGSGYPCTVGQIIEIIGDCLGRRLVCEPGVGKPDLKPSVYASIECARRELDWQPVLDIRQGLDRTVNAMMENDGRSGAANE